jgi:heme A synthase
VTAPTTRYRRLALVTALATFVLILVGGVVRVSDSGLGCGPAHSGVHGWPFCNGDVVPGVALHSVIEYSHRIVASVVVVLVLALTVGAWRRYRGHRGLVWASTAALALIVAQALLGAATVEHDLNEGLVAAHLGMAMAVLGLTLYVWRASRPETIGAPPPAAGRGLRPLAVATAVAVFCTIVAGGYMAGTERYGRTDRAITVGAHEACGHQFPTCNDGFMPFGRNRLVDIHLTHRAFMYLTVALALSLVVLALRRRPSRGVVRSAWLLLGLLCLQVLAGALNVWLGEYEALIVTHLALATLLWAAALGLALQLFRVPAPVPARDRRRRTEAVAA